MNVSLLRIVALGVVAVSPVASAAQPPARWAIETKPVVNIGASDADTTDLLATVVGATRLPDGRILVGDRGGFALRLFSPAGKPLRQFGRKGSGPGEVTYLKALLRCGDSLVTLDVDGNRVSVFSLDGRYVRSFRFGSPQPGRPPYDTACNNSGVFLHHGWEGRADMKGGAYRASVPFWISDADSAVRRVIGSYPGAERFGLVVDNKLRGSRPLPLGKQPVLALAADRVYIGTADRYEIMAFDFVGRQISAIRKPTPNGATTRADIAYAREQEIGDGGDQRRAAVERAYAEMRLPETLPACAAIRVDSRGHLWVQDYPRGASATVLWTVFDPQGREIASVELPVHLEVYEIGDDYVLGRFMDPDESIPQVRMFRLDRGARNR